MTRIRFKGSPRSFGFSPSAGIKALKDAVSPLLVGAPLGTVTNVDRCAGLSTLPGVRNRGRRLCRSLDSGVGGASRCAMTRRNKLQRRLRIAGIFEHPAARIVEPLALCCFVIAGRIIMHGAGMVAMGGAVGAGEISNRIGEVGVGIAQARSVAA